MPELKSENSSESTERMDGLGSWCGQNLTRIEREKLGSVVWKNGGKRGGCEEFSRMGKGRQWEIFLVENKQKIT